MFTSSCYQEQSSHLSSSITWHFWIRTALVVSQVPCFAIPRVVSSSAYPPPPAYATKNNASMGGWGVFQAQKLLYKSFAKLCTAVPRHMVGLRHFVEDVGIVNSDADGKPEYLLPGLVWFVRNEIPKKTTDKGKEMHCSAKPCRWDARNNPRQRSSSPKRKAGPGLNT